MKKTVGELGLGRCIEMVNEVFENHDESFIDWIIDCDKRRNDLCYKDIYREVVFKYFDYKKGCQGAHKILDAFIRGAYDRKKKKIEEERKIEEEKKNNISEIDTSKIAYAVSKEIYGKVDLDTYIKVIRLMMN